METVDEEVTAGAIDFMERAAAAKKPFFLWWNSTRMHVNTHLKAESDGVTGLGIYADGMVEHDGHVGQLLDKLDALGLADNTIVMYSSDNGAEIFLWPDGGMTPFRNEKNSNWEGGYRVPTLIRWPGVIKPGTVYNDVFSHEDMLPTILAAAGEPDIKAKLKSGHSAMGRDYKVHLDGYNLMPYFKGDASEGPRKEFFYWTDDGQLANLRFDRWKMVFMEQRAHGFEVWQEPLVTLRVPKLFDMRGDPFERADHDAEGYHIWRFDRAYLILPAVNYVAQHLATYQEFPPRQKPGTFNLNRVLETLQSNPGNN
jgi:arylsulfatase